MSCIASYYNLGLIGLILLNHCLNHLLCKILHIESVELKRI